MSATHPPHVVLLGDSIFDNASYVLDGKSVVEHLRHALPDWQATLLAVDGHVTKDVIAQLNHLPTGVTHFAVSVGGNDALRASSVLRQPVTTAEALMEQLLHVQQHFVHDYQEMLRALLTYKVPTIVCTIYDAIPGLPKWQAMALSIFNDIITREAASIGAPIIDLRTICSHTADYSSLSPIEPSDAGGRKIAAALAIALAQHNFDSPYSAIYLP